MAEVRALSLEEFLGDPATERLLQLHAQESTLEGRLELEREAYDFLEQAGLLFVLGLYHAVGAEPDALVGYSVNTMSPLLHFRRRLVCQNNALFVDPHRRERGLGRRLMRATADEARARGAQSVFWSAKPGSRLSGIAAQHRWFARDIIFQEDLVHG
jgi:GNAT superfamily N-acetyltransferase